MRIELYDGQQTEKGITIAYKRNATMKLSGSDSLIVEVLDLLREKRKKEGSLKFDFDVVIE